MVDVQRTHKDLVLATGPVLLTTIWYAIRRLMEGVLLSRCSTLRMQDRHYIRRIGLLCQRRQAAQWFEVLFVNSGKEV